MRIIHTSDTHLGHQQYPRTDASGLNLREQDHAKAFHDVIDTAVATKPDLFVHAGDLFDGVRPSNRALATALEGFLKLSRAGIPTVLIAGNHEHPKLRETGSALRLLSHLPHLHVVYQGHAETFTFNVRGQTVRVHAVPQCQDNDHLAREVAALTKAPDRGLDVLVVHGAVSSLKSFSHAEFNEQTLEASWFDARFDYVALGHYHGVQQVAPRAWYCGAPDRVSMAESGQEKGYLEVEVGPGTANATFRALAGRPYADLPVLDATGLDGPAIVATAKARMANAPDGAVVRLRIQNVDAALRGSLDLRTIQEAGRRFAHLDLTRIEWTDAGHAAGGQADFGALGDEFAQFAAKTPIEGVDRAHVLELARHAFAAKGAAA